MPVRIRMSAATLAAGVVVLVASGFAPADHSFLADQYRATGFAARWTITEGGLATAALGAAQLRAAVEERRR